jgi:hypothetical protein
MSLQGKNSLKRRYVLTYLLFFSHFQQQTAAQLPASARALQTNSIHSIELVAAQVQSVDVSQNLSRAPLIFILGCGHTR